MPEFTVLLPVFNGEKYLDEAIQSILSQTYSDWHLLILNHHSQDRSREIAERYAAADRRIQIETVSADGLADLLNKGLQMADGRYVMRQDADDISHQNRMVLTKKAFDENPGIVAVGGQCNFITETGRRSGRTSYPLSTAGVAAAALFYNPIAHPAVTFDLHRFDSLNCSYGAALIGTLPRDGSMHIRDLVEDYFLFGQLAILNHCVNTREVLIDYRMHQASVSRLKSEQQLAKSVEVSQFMTEQWCKLQGCNVFDVKPFTNHGTRLFKPASRNYGEQFTTMSQSLIQGLGQSPELSRELAFRRVLADRSKVIMGLRFAAFAAQHRPTSFEFHTVLGWLKQNPAGLGHA